MKCTYRANTDCRMPSRAIRANTDMNCQLCLIGQLCDETSLNTSAIMNLSIDKTEEGMSEQEWMDMMAQKGGK